MITKPSRIVIKTKRFVIQSSVFIRGDQKMQSWLASHLQETSSLGYIRSHDGIFRSPLMKTLDWSVETLSGLDYNPTGLCHHLFKPEASET